MHCSTCNLYSKFMFITIIYGFTISEWTFFNAKGSNLEWKIKECRTKRTSNCQLYFDSGKQMNERASRRFYAFRQLPKQRYNWNTNANGKQQQNRECIQWSLEIFVDLGCIRGLRSLLNTPHTYMAPCTADANEQNLTCR